MLLLSIGVPAASVALVALLSSLRVVKQSKKALRHRHSVSAPFLPPTPEKRLFTASDVA
ncbi:hypothetical protein [Candidatus Frankia alpina]|uniref:hypothetical protein n=1 Tax=Candidatus Frankia alpina TaxID=2699483 RepID=UPI0013D51977|nr:hypothetical protein [Candidatus Frankia alpina]